MYALEHMVLYTLGSTDSWVLLSTQAALCLLRAGLTSAGVGAVLAGNPSSDPSAAFLCPFVFALTAGFGGPCLKASFLRGWMEPLLEEESRGDPFSNCSVP